MTTNLEAFARRYGPAALVTGASSGIGESFARLLAERGLDLILVARRGDRIEALATELREQHGVDALAVPLDLVRRDFLDALLTACAGRDIGLVVSNAGVGAKGLLHETTPEALEQMLDLNCRAPLLLARSFAPRLLERGRGGILFTGSIEGYLGFPHSAGYSASKAFVHSFADAIWEEYRERGIDVLLVAPGATDTEMLPNLGMTAEELGAMPAERVAREALERLGRGPALIPGLANRVFVRTLRMLPRRLALRLAGGGMRSAIERARRRARADSSPDTVG